MSGRPKILNLAATWRSRRLSAQDHAVPAAVAGAAALPAGAQPPSAGVRLRGGGSQLGLRLQRWLELRRPARTRSSTASAGTPARGPAPARGGGYYPGYRLPGWGGGGYYPGVLELVVALRLLRLVRRLLRRLLRLPGAAAAAATVYHHVRPDSGSIRVLVDPEEARVYVDGYYAGDGGRLRRPLPAPLRVSWPPRDRAQARRLQDPALEGLRRARATLKIKHDMEKGQGETFEDLRRTPARARRGRERGAGAALDRGRGARTREDELTAPWAAGSSWRAPRRRLGLHRRRVQRLGPRGLVAEARAGRHRIEIVRPGFRTFDREVEVAPGEPTSVEGSSWSGRRV